MLCAQSHDCDTPKLPLLKTGIVLDQLELWKWSVLSHQNQKSLLVWLSRGLSLYYFVTLKIRKWKLTNIGFSDLIAFCIQVVSLKTVGWIFIVCMAGWPCLYQLSLNHIGDTQKGLKQGPSRIITANLSSDSYEIQISRNYRVPSILGAMLMRASQLTPAYRLGVSVEHGTQEDSFHGSAFSFPPNSFER